MRAHHWLCACGLGALATSLACAAPEYTRGGPITTTGQAPSVRVHELSEHQGRRTLVIAFGPGDQVLSGLTQLARERGWKSAHFSGIGSFSAATLGAYDMQRQEYRKLARRGMLEVVSFNGNVALDPEAAPIVHAHAAVADEDGAVTGGHLLEATVAATLELFLTEEPTLVRKTRDDALGSNVIR